MSAARPSILALTGLAVLVGACTGPNEGAKPGPERGPEANPEANLEASPAAGSADAGKPAASPEPAQPGDVDGADRAYFAVAGAGVFRVDALGWSFAAGTRATVEDLAEIAGELHLLTSFGVQRGASATELRPVVTLERSGYEQVGAPRAMAGDGRRVWLVGEQGVGRHDGSWSFTSAESLGATGAPTGASLAVDDRGRAWLAWGGLHRDAGEGWARVELPGEALAGEAHGAPGVVLASADGQTILVHGGCRARPQPSCTLLRYRGDEVEPIELATGTCAAFPGLALSPDGTQAALVGACGLVRVRLDQPAGAELRTTAAGGWVGVEPTAVALDDSGRVWAGVGHSFVVVGAGPAGALARYPLARLTDISGIVDSILVTGAGPTPPPLGDERRGGLRAQLVTLDAGGAEAPVANARVELCSRGEALGRGASGPRCRPDAVRAALTSDGEGRIAAEDLPLDAYFFSVELDGGWGMATSKPATMRAGMAGNIGKLVVEPPR